jgi:hypothetical protein
MSISSRRLPSVSSFEPLRPTSSQWQCLACGFQPLSLLSIGLTNSGSFPHMLFIATILLVYTFQLFTFLMSIPRLLELHRFYEHLLGVPDVRPLLHLYFLSSIPLGAPQSNAPLLDLLFESSNAHVTRFARGACH